MINGHNHPPSQSKAPELAIRGKEIEERYHRAKYEELHDFDKPEPGKPFKAIYAIIPFILFVMISQWHDQDMRKAEKSLEKQGYSDQQIRDWMEDQAHQYDDHP